MGMAKALVNTKLNWEIEKLTLMSPHFRDSKGSGSADARRMSQKGA